MALSQLPTNPARSGRRAVALMSGGMDSTFAVYWMVRHHPGVLDRGVFINYGQKGAAWEWQCAKRIMDGLALQATYMDLSDLPLMGGSILQSSSESLDPSTKDEHGRPGSFVPGRNLIHLAVLAPLIDRFNYTAVVGGWNAVDVEYPDCQGPFLDSVGTTIALALGREEVGVEIVAPALQLTKAEEVSMGTVWGVPWELTRSCYTDNIFACGKCDSCLVRAKAFYENTLDDPAYASMEDHVWDRVVQRLKDGGYVHG